GSSNTGSATLNLNSVSDITGIMSSGSPYSLTTTTPGQNALLTFSGAAGQKVSVDATISVSSSLVPFTVSIRNPDGSVLASGTAGPTTGGVFIDEQSLATTGTYTI